MSKPKESRPSLVADWEVTLLDGDGNQYREITVRRSTWKRDEYGSYVFRDENGPAAVFSAPMVQRLQRVDHGRRGGISGDAASGWRTGCLCGMYFMGTSEQHAEDAFASHLDGSDA